jgi:ribosomal protein S18 acetylase RimI-like enzyme
MGVRLVNIRTVEESDYFTVISVLDDWWGGRQMTHLLPRLFFEYFNNTSFVVEENGQIIAFLIGFISQSRPNEAYIHFVGVHPDYRNRGLARHLYEEFFRKVRQSGCDTVRCITSPINEGSIAFHTRMGFSATLATEYAGPGQDRVLFTKTISP